MPNINTTGQTGDVYLTPFKCYVALLTQLGGAVPPTAVVLNAGDSNYLGNIVWSYSDVGIYYGTLTGVFTENKTATIFGANGTNFFLSGGRSTNDIILVQTNASQADRDDGGLYELYFEVRVYP